MSGLQKPFANEKKPEAAPAKKGGFFGKLIKLILLAIILGLVGSMVWNGKKLGEADAALAWDKSHPADQTRDQALANASIRWPWKWSTPEWEGWGNQVKSTVMMAGQTAEDKAKQAWAAARAKVAEWKSKPAATTTVSTTPATPATPGTTGATTTNPGTTTTPPATTSNAEAADLAKARGLIAEGGDLFEKSPADAKKKLDEAVALLKPYMDKQPVNQDIKDAYETASNTIEALKDQKQY